MPIEVRGAAFRNALATFIEHDLAKYEKLLKTSGLLIDQEAGPLPAIRQSDG